VQSYFFFGTIMRGYQVQSLLLIIFFYYCRPESLKQWKVQPAQDGGLLGNIWIHPLLSSKPQRAPWHKQITALNLILASTFAGACSELAIRGYSSISFDMIPLSNQKSETINSFYEMFDYLTRMTAQGCAFYDLAHCAGRFLWQLTLALAYQSVLEYVWHLAMHIPWVYKTFHKIHHTLKAPEVWDDLYIHPVEACGYYIILYSPAFVIGMNVISFLAYMAILGVAGVVDHSGIRLRIPGLYDSRDHDRHHQFTYVNFAFPFPYLDMLGGTYMASD
jgi:hypothetical protein